MDDDLFVFDDEPVQTEPDYTQVQAAAENAGRVAAEQFVQRAAAEITQARAAADYIALEKERVLARLRQEFPFLDTMINSDEFWRSEPVLFEAIAAAANSPAQVSKLEGIFRIAAKIYANRAQQPAQPQPNAPAQPGYYAPQAPPQRAPAQELKEPDLSSSRDRQRYIREFEQRFGDVEI